MNRITAVTVVLDGEYFFLTEKRFKLLLLEEAKRIAENPWKRNNPHNIWFFLWSLTEDILLAVREALGNDEISKEVLFESFPGAANLYLSLELTLKEHWHTGGDLSSYAESWAVVAAELETMIKNEQEKTLAAASGTRQSLGIGKCLSDLGLRVCDVDVGMLSDQHGVEFTLSPDEDGEDGILFVVASQATANEIFQLLSTG